MITTSVRNNDKIWAQRVIHGDYQPHIDGMRSIAVLSVVFFHLQHNLCPGGFIGVDIFFAISGYLICGGIFRDLQAGTFSMKSFYYRRIRRIFPAYLAIVFFVLIAGIVLYHWARILPLAQTALFSSFFSANIYFWLVTGYFQPTANGNPLLHLWSLGVEEQFYIVIPLALLLFWRLGRKHIRAFIFICLLASLALCIFFGEKGQSTTCFYLLPFRSWELLAGGVVAILPRASKLSWNRLLATVGIVILIFCFACISTAQTFGERGTRVEIYLPFMGSLGTTPYPGWVTLLIIVASLVLLRYGNDGPVGAILCSRPFVAVGRISYSLYLWHWPVFVFADYIRYGQAQTVWSECAALLISFLAAYLSWRFVEMPVRVSSGFTKRRAFTLMPVGCAILAAATVFLIVSNGLQNILHRKANLHVSAPWPFLNNFKKFTTRPDFQASNYPSIDSEYIQLLGKPGQPPSFCLVGDSHAGALAPGLDVAASEWGQSGVYIKLFMHPQIEEGSQNTVQKLLGWVATQPEIHDVYVVCRWLSIYRVQNGLAKLGEKGRVQPYSPPNQTVEQLSNNLQQLAEWFTRHGKHVYFFTSVPDYGYAPDDVIARREIIPMNFPIEITLQDYLNRQAPLLHILKSLEQKSLITIVPLHTAFFSGDTSIVSGPTGSPYYQDNNHLTPEAAKYAARTIALLLWGAPKQSP